MITTIEQNLLDLARQHNQNAKRWVIKIGSSLMTDHGRGIAQDSLKEWVRQIARLRELGIEVAIVSSGAVAEGIVRLGWQKRPDTLHELQAAAAIGQMGLVRAWESAFDSYQIKTAQILFTHEDVKHRERYLNARNTLRTLLSLGVIPIINENDTVAIDEIRLGDNDTLGALTANLIEADLLVIMTDQQGLFNADPRNNPEAKLIEVGMAGDLSLLAMAGGSGSLGRGGMRTKLTAAALAAKSGSHTRIAYGKNENLLINLQMGANIGTHLLANQTRASARKQWLAGHLQLRGTLQLDAGAVRALLAGGSLLPIGVKAIEGDFNNGDVVKCCDMDGTEIARGLVNYAAHEAAQIIGKASNEIVNILGHAADTVLVHRDDLVMT